MAEFVLQEFVRQNDNPFARIDAGNYIKPTFADIDSDGDLDLVVGKQGGGLRYYENTGTTESPVYNFVRNNPFANIEVTGYNGIGYSAPTFEDIDGDGLLDLVVGNRNGDLSYYENTGTAESPIYTTRRNTDNPFNDIDVGIWAAPTFADVDNDGDLDLVVGEYNGNLNYFENTGSADNPAYTERTGSANPLNGFDSGSFSAPTFVDIDGDGDLDLFVGQWGGFLHLYENTGSEDSPTYTVRAGSANPFYGISFNGFSAPTFEDIDGDGDLDLVVGNDFGELVYFKNTVGDPIEGTSNPDEFTGTDGADEIKGLGGNDVLRGEDGDDTLDGGADADTLNGGAGADTLTGGSGSDTFVFNTGDSRVGEGNRDVITDFSVGTDKIDLSSFASSFNAGGTFSSTAGEVIVSGNLVQVDTDGDGTADFEIELGTENLVLSESDFVFEEPVTSPEPEPEPVLNTIRGTEGVDELTGTGGADDIQGLGGNDVLAGGDGDDTLSGGNGDDTLTGSNGDDVLAGGNNNDDLKGGNGNDDLKGGNGNDTLAGGNNNDDLQGGRGNDVLAGGRGADTLTGGGGADTLTGGGDDDTLTGGGGSDTFVFSANAGADVVTDFVDNVDTVQLSASDFTQTTGQQIIDSYASVNDDGHVVLDFQNGNSITFEGLTDQSLLVDDITFV